MIGLTPSQETVLKKLKASDKPISAERIAEATLVSLRTVRRALTSLRKLGRIKPTCPVNSPAQKWMVSSRKNRCSFCGSVIK